MKVIKDDQLIVLQQAFDNECTVTIAIRKMQVNQALGKFENISGVKTKFDYTV